MQHEVMDCSKCEADYFPKEGHCELGYSSNATAVRYLLFIKHCLLSKEGQIILFNLVIVIFNIGMCYIHKTSQFLLSFIL